MDNSIVDLVYDAKGDSLKIDSLIETYLPFIKSEASKATGKIINSSSDELSIAMIGFHEAVESYSKTRGAFLNYAAVVMKRKLIDYHRREKRHLGHMSLETPMSSEDDITLMDTIAASENPFEDMHMRDATMEEIMHLSEQLSQFDLSLTDIVDNSPKQDKTLSACWKVLSYARETDGVIAEIVRTKKLPITQLSQATGVSKKTLERHRKYLMAIMIIHSNGYEIIRGHLKQVLYSREEGVIA